MIDVNITESGLLVYSKEYPPNTIRELIKKKKLKGLRIVSASRIDKLESINFLKECSFLECLEISSIYDFDFSFLTNLTNLKELTINVEGESMIDLSNQNRLTFLSVKWRKGIKGLERCSSITSLGLHEYTEKDLSRVSNFSKIEDLRVKTATIQSLSGIERFRNLKKLFLGNCKKLVSIKAVNNLLYLTKIEFDICPKIQNYQEITNLPMVQELKLADCGRITSINFIESLSSLSSLYLLGNTIIDDGNTLPAKNIKNVFYKHYKHYNYELDTSLQDKIWQENMKKIKKL